jgi:hypothetical protein
VAKHRTSVPTKLKEQLRQEAGGKCANPGCAATRTHLHHIREWAVYETHDAKHMIAICPNCHEDVHHRQLAIDDETIYRWKHIKRSKTQRDHVYVEPGESSKLLLGTIAVTGQEGVTVFDLGDSTKLSFRLIDEDVMLLNLAVSTTAGDEVLRVVDGHVRHQAGEPVTYQRVQGHVRVEAPVSDDFMPEWAIGQLRLHEPDFAADGRLQLLDIEVVEPGLVRVQGVWNAPAHVVAITKERLAFLDPDRLGPLAMAGEGAESILHFTGPITTALFRISDGSGSLHIPKATAPKVGRNEPCWCGSGKKFKKCHGA